ncbi:TIGR03885 family FMN-dependent LLM class oxidoreductase [Nesterenkonia sphaerica]|uniref:TIGR03885 family FMN-dependent LLM class oxidoreductase n=1 Tax=Nesterenkonia sphaerica TaxID=1804988 RepID=A0A5R9AE63_9MICC|nr:TIGR03885 family FMN-dependent LLM class oxidoreductase [Nesterenkonia sphaerica]TLP76913.1 TIGR03885 family FMN-dependent LLM class oxidoreductase [Nesterenkonia sphaerica]
MTVYGFHASQEQISPSQLLRDVQRAESAGFDAAMSSDHFFPWSHRQGHSGFTFSWLGAALSSTSFPIGSVCVPGQRYHPAVVAQATATLGEMFPGRYWVALGAGQAMNEHITGEKWLPLQRRRDRLEESAVLIRRLHRGEWITEHRGQVEVQDAYLYDRPERPIPLYATCITPESAQRAARWADGFITLNQPDDAHYQVCEAYRDAGGQGPALLQVHLSWAPTDQAAEQIAYDQWRNNTFGPPLDQDLPTPEHFDTAAGDVRLSTVLEAVWTSSSPSAHTEWIAQASQSFDAIYLHHVGQDQTPWLETAGEHILPALTRDATETGA